MGSEQCPCLQPETVLSPVTPPGPQAGLGSAPGGPQPCVRGNEGPREEALCRSVPGHSWQRGGLHHSPQPSPGGLAPSLRPSGSAFPALHQCCSLGQPPVLLLPGHPSPFTGVHPDAGTALGAAGRRRPLVLQGREGSAPCWHPAGAAPAPDPAGAPRLEAAWGQDHPDRSSRCPSGGVGLHRHWGAGAPGSAPGRGRGAVAVLLRQLGGARSLRVPWFLPQPWLSQAERCPGRWRVALLQLLPPPSPLPATAPLPKNPTGDNAS